MNKVIDMNQIPSFKKGTYELHENSNINYQLNRAINWSNADVELIKKKSSNLRNIKSLVDKCYAEAVIQEQKGNIDNAIACYRLVDFFLGVEDNRKLTAYNRALKLFNLKNYKYFESNIVEKGFIKYDKKRVPYYLVNPEGKLKDTLILHGGFDSYMEEFFDSILYLRSKGYRVILFDGPGQGYANRIEKIPFTFEWERIVTAIHDKFDINESTIIGLSLGAMLAPRAAAFEKRIKRVVSVGLMHNFYDILISTRNKRVQNILKILFKFNCKNTINFLINNMMKNDMLAEWGIRHGMEIFNSKTPFEFFKKAKKYNVTDIGMNVSQDILILAGDNDHFIPINFYKLMIDAFSNVNSMTFRIFNNKECAENHCQVGNCKLLLDTIDSWLSERL